MFEPQRKLMSHEFVYSWLIVLFGLVLTLIVQIRSSLPEHWVEIETAVGTAIGTAILAAGFVNIASLAFGYWAYKTKIEPFEIFWGQRLGSRVAGSIILQSDRIEALFEQLGAGDSEEIKDWKAKLNEPFCNGEVNRFFKARQWINKFDAEGAKYLREIFLGLGFTPPNFIAIERPSKSIPIGRKGSTTSIYDRSATRIYMGLGHTEDIPKIVNDSCTDIHVDNDVPQFGDAISVTPTVFRNLEKGIFKPTASGKTEFIALVREAWDHTAYVNGESTHDYGFIFRHKSKGAGVVFHVAGFTEEGTAAAGKYLAKEWKELHKTYVKDPEGYGTFYVLLIGEIPFTPESRPWEIQYPRKNVLRRDTAAQ